jgi:hypothetical protein
VKNPFAWFESVSGAPPISARVVAVAIHIVCSATGKIGVTGVVICYFGSRVAIMARAFYYHSSFFRGWGWQFIAGCMSALENRVNTYACYFYGLGVFPLALSLFLRLLGIHEPGASKEMGDLNAVKRPHQFARRVGAWLLLVPSVQVFLGTLAGVMTLALVLVLIAVHSLVGCRRYGGILYFWMRVAVRIGMRRAMGRWSR